MKNHTAAQKKAPRGPKNVNIRYFLSVHGIFSAALIITTEIFQSVALIRYGYSFFD